MGKRALCIVLSAALVLSSNYMTASGAKKAKLSSKRITLNEGEKKKIVIKNKNKKAVYSFTSSAKKVASVTKKGVVKAKSEGKAKITVKEAVKKNGKKAVRKVGVVTVTCTNNDKVKVTTAPAITGNPTSVPSTQPPVVNIDTTSTPVPTNEPTPEPTPDVYTKTVMSVYVTDKEVYSVNGSTCDVTMQYFNGSADGDFFNGKTTSDGSVVFKDYKEGDNIYCARYMLSGTDDTGKQCRMFIEDNGIEDTSGNFVSKPIIITDSESLSWLETADIQGRVTDLGNGEKVIDIVWNESNTEPVDFREVVRPDMTKDYSKEVFVFNIDIGASEEVKGSNGNASMIHFRGSSDCAAFKGKIVSDCADTRLQYSGQVQTLSARYILEGTDADGDPCKIYVENNGIDDNGMVTEPTIITDNPDFAGLRPHPLHGTVSWGSKLNIHMWTTP